MPGTRGRCIVAGNLDIRMSMSYRRFSIHLNCSVPCHWCRLVASSSQARKASVFPLIHFQCSRMAYRSSALLCRQGMHPAQSICAKCE
jgi:hypothetical protein